MSAVPRRRVRDDQRGTSLIEFALVLPFLLVLTFIVIDLSRAFYVRSVAWSAAREGARTAIVLNSAYDSTGQSADYVRVQARINEVLAPAGLALATPPSVVGGQTANSPIAVRIQVNFTWLYLGVLKYLGITGITNPQPLTAFSVMQKIS